MILDRNVGDGGAGLGSAEGQNWESQGTGMGHWEKWAGGTRAAEQRDWEHKMGMTGSRLGGPAGTAWPWEQAGLEALCLLGSLSQHSFPSQC